MQHLTGTGSYSVGESVTVNAGSRNDYTFSGWTITAGGVTLSSSTSASSSFIMPERDVVVTAIWAPVSSSGGGGSSGGGSGGSGGVVLRQVHLQVLLCQVKLPSQHQLSL